MNRPSDSGKLAVSLLAVFIVLVMGAASCGMIILSAVDHPLFPLIGTAIFFAIVAIACLRAIFANQRQANWDLLGNLLALGRQKNQHVAYRVKRRRPSQGDAGANRPPTVEELRSIARDNVRWIPHDRDKSSPNQAP